MSNIKVLGDLELSGALRFSQNYTDFPQNPSPRTIVVKDGIPYIYTELVNGSGFFSWQPIGIKQASYIHSQGVASTTWTVTHNFNTNDFAYFVYDSTHRLVIANIEIIDVNSVRILLSEAMVGTVVMFSLQYLNSTTVSASQQLNLGSSALTTNAGVLEVAGNPVAFKSYVDSQDSALSTRIDNIVSNIDPVALDSLAEIVTAFQGADGSLSTAISSMGSSSASTIAAETTRALGVEAGLQSAITAEIARAEGVEAGLANDIANIGDNLATVATSGSYTDLSNTPSIPTKVSELSNDSGFVTSSQSSSSVNVERTRALLAEAGISADVASETIRAVTAETGLSTRIDNITTGKADLASLATVATTGQYSDLGGKPTHLSEFTNDAGLQTSAQVSSAIASAIIPKASTSYVDTQLALKASTASVALKANLTDIPTLVSHFTNDSDYQSGSDVDSKIQAVIGAAPSSLKTLGDLATALANDESAASALTTQVGTLSSSITTLGTSIGGKADKATTLGGYGINDAYTKSDVNSGISSAISALSSAVNTELALKANLTDIPTVVSHFTNDSGYQTSAQVTSAIAASGYASAAALATVATSGAYSDLTGKPTLFGGAYSDLTGKPALFSGAYSDLTGKPSIPSKVSDLTNDDNFQTLTQVNDAIQSVLGAAPDALNTLAEIATQLAQDESAVAALTTTITGKAEKATTIAGYGIVDAYTKAQVNASLAGKADQSYVDTHLASKEDIANLAAVAESGNYSDLHGKPFIPALTSDLTNDRGFQTAAQVTSAISASGLASASGSSTVDFSVKRLTVSGDIMPAISGVSNIGSATDKFGAIYTKEMHIDANTLYVDGVPVLGSSANTINITADVNQGMRIATTGSGVLVLNAEASTTVSTTGANADVVIQSTGVGGLTRLSSATQVTLTAPTIATVGNQTVSGSLTIAGDLTVAGAHTTVNSTSMTVEDNIVTLNKGEPTDGITLDSAGIEIDRGALARQRLIYKQSVDKWMIGPAGGEANVATESYVTTTISGKANTSSLATVATSGSYNDLTSKPTLFDGAYASLTGKPNAVSAFTNDSGFQTAANVTTAIANKADKSTTLSGYGITNAYTKTEVDTALALKVNTSSLSTVATSGSYADLTSKPTLFSGSYADLTSKPTLFSGAYADLTGKPTIPTVPTALSSFTNDSGFQTAANVTSAIQAVVGAAPAALDTLAEIAAQLQSDESVASALTTTVSNKADKATTVAGYGITDAATLNGSQTLSNKTLSSPVVTGTLDFNSIMSETVFSSTGVTTSTAVYTFPIATYRSAEYTLQLSNGSAFKLVKVLVVHNGTTVTISGNYLTDVEVTSGTLNSTYSFDISSGSLRLLVASTSGTTDVKGSVKLFKI